MAVRKSVEETVVVAGGRDEWLTKAQLAMEKQGFSKVEASETFGQVSGKYKKATVWGDLQVTLTPEGDAQTRMVLKATANVDNVFAAFSSPGKKIITRFKEGLP